MIKLQNILEDLLKGGKGDNLDPSKVDQHELRLGIKHESEHTNNPKIAKEIALDHLSEDPKYYTNLSNAGIDEIKVNKGPSYNEFAKIINICLVNDSRKVLKIMSKYNYIPQEGLSNFFLRLSSKQQSQIIDELNELNRPVNESQLNISYYEQILNKSNLSQSTRDFYGKLLKSLRNKSSISPKQQELLNKLKSGNFNYSSRN